MLKQFTNRIYHALVLGVGISAAISSAVGQEVAAWQINQAASMLVFNTTKAGTAGVGGTTETMEFKKFRGGLSAKGQMELTIELASVDSGIAIRDERLTTLFWNVAAQPTVSFAGQLSNDDMKKIAVGKEPMVVMVAGQLTMAGQSKPVTAQLQVTFVNKKLHVSTRQPIVVKADEFGLTTGAEALRAIMGLNYLSTSVPVTFSLVLDMAASTKVGTDTKLPPSAW